MVKKVSLQDVNFLGYQGCSREQSPSLLKWDRLGVHQTVFFTDICLPYVDNPQWTKTKKVAWILEPKAIDPRPYDYVEKYPDKFDYILSHHIEWVSEFPKGLWYPNAMTWIPYVGRKIWQKSKNLSMVVSSKQLTSLQRDRHWLAEKVPQFDIMGSKYQWFDEKADSLIPYRFQIVLENCRVPGYFSEKIVDCFLCGTIPIYIGDPQINQYFDSEGILQFSNKEELLNFVIETEKSDDWEDLYRERFSSIQSNFAAAQNYLCAEDWIAQNLTLLF